MTILDYSTVYTTLDAIKDELGIDTDDTDDDAMLEWFIRRASRQIDRHCRRTFVGIEDTRTFNALEDVDGQDLLLDYDLLTVTEVINGDSDVIESSEYITLPQNFSPSYAIRLKSNSTKMWTYVTHHEDAISVEGVWGYSTGTPDDIEQATIALAVYRYKKRKNPFLQVGVSQSGLAQVSSNIPDDILDLLNPFVRAL